MKKFEYQFNFVHDLRVSGEVPFSVTLKNLHWQERSSLHFQVNLSDGAHFSSSSRFTVCNIAKSNGYATKKDSIIYLFKVANKQTQVLRG